MRSTWWGQSVADPDYFTLAEIEWEATQRAASHRNDLASLERDARGYVHTRRDGAVEVLPYGWHPLVAPADVRTYDPEQRRAVAAPPPPPPAPAPVVDTEVAVLDTETTGLERDARITELAVVIVSLPSGRIVRRSSQLIDPGASIPAMVSRLTGITDAMCAGKPALADLWPRIVAAVGDRPVVAHNAAFDRGRLEYELDRAFLGRPAWRWFCSKALAKRVIPGRDTYSLQPLTTALGVARGTAHRALGDCLTTAALLTHLARGRAWPEWAAEPSIVWVPTVREPAAQTPLLMIGGIQ
jgi:DNA polymerase-3 subunit epsilon